MRSVLVKVVGNLVNMTSIFSESFAANKALSIFTSPRKRRYTEEQRDFLGTSYKEELSYNGLEVMTYRWLGKKEPILLLHGWESNAYRWRSIITNLKKRGHPVIAVDAPAHGNSGSKEFNAVLYAEFINVVSKRFKPSIVIGHSVGGMAAVIAINKYEISSISKLILLGAPSEFTDVFKRYTDMMGYNSKIVAKTRSVIIERFGKKPEDFSTAQYLKTIKSKGLIIHDEEDTIIPYNDALMLNESFENSKLITTQGLGHSLNDETIEKHICEFIES